MNKVVAKAKEIINLQVSNKALLDDDNIIKELLKLFTYLLMALTQAIAFINQNSILLSEYVLLFRDANSEAELFNEHFEDPSEYEEMESTIAKTWYISFNQIREQDPLATDYVSFEALRLPRWKLQIHTLPDETPMATLLPNALEHDGRYSEGSQSIFLLLYMIHVLSSLTPPPWNWACRGSAGLVALESDDGLIAIVLESVRRYELVGSNDIFLGILPTRSVCRHAPLLVSQILTVLSNDADASRVESCEKATELT